jgi:aarF domain-containing kinase
MKVAFARLMYSAYETDVDGLMQAFDEMGLKFNNNNDGKKNDPFEDMAAMQRGFSDTVPQEQAQQAAKEKSQAYQERVDAMKHDQNVKPGEKLRNPVDAWPAEFVFFGRVTNMLRGLCSHLNVRYPYLETMADAALQTLKDAVPVEERAVDRVHSSAMSIDTDLQRRLINILHTFQQQEGGESDEKDASMDAQMIGLQLCVISNGEQVANIASGVLGKANPRPVTPSTLFCIFSVSKAILSIGMLRLVQEGQIELDEPVSTYWPAFASNGKEGITVRHVLSHQAGLANAMPENVTVDALLDWTKMKETMETATPVHGPGEETQYHYLTYAWLTCGIMEAITGRPYEEYLHELIVEPLMLDDLHIGGLPSHVDNEELAVLSVSKPPAQAAAAAAAAEQQKKEQEQNPAATSQPEKAKAQKATGKSVLAKYRGKEHLLNPSIFNMRKVREAKLPSANGHASATALATVFDALIMDDTEHRPNLLSKDTLQKARTKQIPSKAPSSNSALINSQVLQDSSAGFGLGLQIHEFALSDGVKGRRTVCSIGHAGFGGSLVVAIPELKLSVAFTTNMLSSKSRVRNTLLRAVFDEFGLEVPSSMNL